MSMIIILGYLFLVIFAATAVITIASLPGWIIISEWYKKKLFLALILEVIGAIIILFQQSFIKQNTDSNQMKTSGDVVINKGGGAEKKLSASKRDNIDTWYIENDTVKLGYVSLKSDQGQLTASKKNPGYFVKKEYPIGSSKLFFKIDSISPFVDEDTLFIYYIRFGEEEPSGGIKWHEKLNEFYKTENGEINLSNGLTAIQQKDWQNRYYIGMGVGEPQRIPRKAIQNNNVQFLNLFLLKVKIE